MHRGGGGPPNIIPVIPLNVALNINSFNSDFKSTSPRKLRVLPKTTHCMGQYLMII
jgi:hypothetical protein